MQETTPSLFLHNKTTFSPVKSIWIKAINVGFFNTWPGFTSELVEKHLHKSEATVKGHLWKILQNLRSTAKKSPITPSIPSTPSTISPPRVMIMSHDCLSSRGFKPQVQMLDNECPKKLKEQFRSQGMTIQLVLTNLHQINAAKRAIATFKDHFIYGIASAVPSFPMHLW